MDKYAVRPVTSESFGAGFGIFYAGFRCHEYMTFEAPEDAWRFIEECAPMPDSPSARLWMAA